MNARDTGVISSSYNYKHTTVIKVDPTETYNVMEDISWKYVEEEDTEAASVYHDPDEPLQSPVSDETPLHSVSSNGGTFEEFNASVQDLIYRHRGTSPLTKKRDRAFSPPADAHHESPKRRSLTETQGEAGKFLVRVAQPSHHNVLSTIYGLDNLREDSETDNLISMIRQIRTNEVEDVDQGALVTMPRHWCRQGIHPGHQFISQITAELAKKFESGKEPEEKKPRSSEPQAGKPDDALHGPADLDSSHADLHDDLDLNPIQTSPDSCNDIEAGFRSQSDESPSYDIYHGDVYDLDSSGSIDQFTLMQSVSFEEPESGKNMLSLADELQQADNLSSSEDDSNPRSNSLSSESNSEAESEENLTEYTIHHYGNGGELADEKECSEEYGRHDDDVASDAEGSDVSAPEHRAVSSQELTSTPSEEQLKQWDECSDDKNPQLSTESESGEDDGKVAEPDEIMIAGNLQTIVEEVADTDDNKDPEQVPTDDAVQSAEEVAGMEVDKESDEVLAEFTTQSTVGDVSDLDKKNLLDEVLAVVQATKEDVADGGKNKAFDEVLTANTIPATAGDVADREKNKALDGLTADTVQATTGNVADGDNNKESSLDGTDLDFSVLQSSQKLNVDVTKQRISLRQKGSLARRRRPTRNSIRAVTNNSEMARFTDSTEPRRQRSPSPEGDDSEEEREQVKRRQEVSRSSSVPGERSNVQARTAPVLLLGLGDHIKRRTTKAPVPLPKLVKPPAMTAAEPAPPPWMAEVRVRRGSRSIKLDLERVPSEPRNPESPSWMRDALTKKKRAAEIMERRASIQPVETEQPTVPPWMKELRRSSRANLAANSHTTNNNLPHTEATPSDVTDLSSNKVSNQNDSTHNIIQQESPRSPFVSNLSENRSKGHHREVLAPLKRSSVDNSAHLGVIDNRLAIPAYLGTTNGQTTEMTPNRNMLPPLKSTSQTSVTSHDDQENSEAPIPVWKKEIAARRKSKTFIPVVKPETPHKLGDVPAWKRELAERNKNKKRDSIDMHTSAPSPNGPSSTPASPSLLPWQQELALRRKRTPSITRQPTSESSPAGTSEVPSWARNVERRRARLADCGLIPESSLDDKSG